MVSHRVLVAGGLVFAALSCIRFAALARATEEPVENRHAAVPTEIVKPPALPEGGVIGIIAPASALEESSVREAVAFLQKRGYRVKLSLGYKQQKGYLASEDAIRAAEVNAYFVDPEVDAILCLRGGYGSPRILDRLDYDGIRRNPKIFIGYSDITALLNAFYTRAGLVTFHGPMAGDLGKGITRYGEEYLWPALRPESPYFADWGGGGPAGRGAIRTVVGGEAEGRLVGGNLSVLVSTLGTPYEVTADGCILFLEDLQEKPFRIDRMLNQLRLSGKLARFSGVILGSFRDCVGNSGITVDEVLDEYFATLKVPVLADFPTGHIPDQVTLPVGVRVRLDATNKQLTILEAPVTPR